MAPSLSSRQRAEAATSQPRHITHLRKVWHKLSVAKRFVVAHVGIDASSIHKEGLQTIGVGIGVSTVKCGRPTFPTSLPVITLLPGPGGLEEAWAGAA